MIERVLRVLLACAIVALPLAVAAEQQPALFGVGQRADVAFERLNHNDAELYAAVATLQAALAGKASTTALATVSAALTGKALQSDVIALATSVSGKATPADIATAVSGLTKANVGLGNVSNLAPADLPVSAATAAVLSGKVASTFLQAGSGAVARDLVSKLRENVPVDPVEFGATGDCLADDTDGMQKAINTGRPLALPKPCYRISATLAMPDGKVDIVGRGSGMGYPDVTASTSIKWYGPPGGDMVRLGYKAGPTVVLGGGLRHLQLDGRGIAGRGFAVKGAQHFWLKDVDITGTTADGWYLTNSTTGGTLPPTGFCQVEDLHIRLRGGGTDNANGINLDGVGSGPEGVTLCIVRRPRIEHANGAGLKIGLKGDAFTWDGFFEFRAASETGPGILFTSTSPDQIVSGHAFSGLSAIAGGIRTSYPGQAQGWTIALFGDVDVQPDTLAAGLVTGPGTADITVQNTYRGRRLGWARFGGYRQAGFSDAMQFRLHDAAAGVLWTGQASYKTGGVGTPAFGDGFGGQLGGAVSLATSATIGDSAWLTSANTAAAGVTADRNPTLVASWSPNSTVDVTARVGLFGDIAALPADAVFVEYDPAISPSFRLRCRSAGVETAVVTPFAGGTTTSQWLLDVRPTGVVAMARIGGNEDFGLAGLCPTNITAARLRPAAFVATRAAASKYLLVNDLRFAHDLE